MGLELAGELAKAIRKAYIAEFVKTDLEAVKAIKENFRRRCRGENTEELSSFIKKRFQLFCELRRQEN